ncbi:unnamed protein product [Amoebophrya sp. A25]|nr:unnamed protein product [Amoebophrya sp. A25]|eukprot:GSA25T00005139001.1
MCSSRAWFFRPLPVVRRCTLVSLLLVVQLFCTSVIANDGDKAAELIDRLKTYEDATSPEETAALKRQLAFSNDFEFRAAQRNHAPAKALGKGTEWGAVKHEVISVYRVIAQNARYKAAKVCLRAPGSHVEGQEASTVQQCDLYKKYAFPFASVQHNLRPDHSTVENLLASLDEPPVVGDVGVVEMNQSTKSKENASPRDNKGFLTGKGDYILLPGWFNTKPAQVPRFFCPLDVPIAVAVAPKCGSSQVRRWMSLFEQLPARAAAHRRHYVSQVASEFLAGKPPLLEDEDTTAANRVRRGLEKLAALHYKYLQYAEPSFASVATTDFSYHVIREDLDALHRKDHIYRYLARFFSTDYDDAWDKEDPRKGVDGIPNVNFMLATNLGAILNALVAQPDLEELTNAKSTNVGDHQSHDQNEDQWRTARAVWSSSEHKCGNAIRELLQTTLRAGAGLVESKGTFFHMLGVPALLDDTQQSSDHSSLTQFWSECLSAQAASSEHITDGPMDDSLVPLHEEARDYYTKARKVYYMWQVYWYLRNSEQPIGWLPLPEALSPTYCEHGAGRLKVFIVRNPLERLYSYYKNFIASAQAVYADASGSRDAPSGDDGDAQNQTADDSAVKGDVSSSAFPFPSWLSQLFDYLECLEGAYRSTAVTGTHPDIPASLRGWPRALEHLVNQITSDYLRKENEQRPTIQPGESSAVSGSSTDGGGHIEVMAEHLSGSGKATRRPIQLHDIDIIYNEKICKHAQPTTDAPDRWKRLSIDDIAHVASAFEGFVRRDVLVLSDALEFGAQSTAGDGNGEQHLKSGGERGETLRPDVAVLRLEHLAEDFSLLGERLKDFDLPPFPSVNSTKRTTTLEPELREHYGNLDPRLKEGLLQKYELDLEFYPTNGKAFLL